MSYTDIRPLIWRVAYQSTLRSKKEEIERDVLFEVNQRVDAVVFDRVVLEGLDSSLQESVDEKIVA